MIPKKIHYVWVGGKQKPKYIKRCIQTWKRKLPEYEFIEWNEDNFDINSHSFIKRAYKAKKWAFVSDYIRAKVLYEHGGIYLDTDVVVLKKLDNLLNNKAFVGFENNKYPFTAVFGSTPKHPFLKQILKYYDSVEFEYDLSDEMKNVNTKIVSNILINQFGCIVNNKEQILKTDIKVYPDYILCNPSKDSYTIHVFTGTWLEKKKSFKRKIVKEIKTRLKYSWQAHIYNIIFKRY